MKESEGVGRRSGGASGQIGRLQDDVSRQLKGRLEGFRLELRGRGIVLHGRVRTYYAKQLAQHAVMRATGVPIVRNEIEVL